MNSCFRTSGLAYLCLALCLSASASTATFEIVADPVISPWSSRALSGNGEPPGRPNRRSQSDEERFLQGHDLLQSQSVSGLNHDQCPL